jgi:hypothetical protein
MNDNASMLKSLILITFLPVVALNLSIGHYDLSFVESVESVETFYMIELEGSPGSYFQKFHLTGSNTINDVHADLYRHYIQHRELIGANCHIINSSLNISYLPQAPPFIS